MTTQDIREHVLQRERTPGGMIARIESERHAGGRGEISKDLNPTALAFIRAAHGRSCGCERCV